MGSWQGKVVIVTGGSGGLGLAIGCAFSQAGATVVLLSRNEEKLRSVCELRAKSSIHLDWVLGDVTSDSSIEAAVESTLKKHGRIDLLVNNVGKSTRVELLNCSVGQYAELMEMNLYSAIRCTLATMDALKATSGQVVNIGSLASKTGWPKVAPYSVSKHGLAAFSHQLRLEGPQNVSCLHVCPGPIRRDDAGTRYDAQASEMAESVAQPGAGVKLKGIDPDVLARKIVRQCERRKPELVIPWHAKILFTITQLSPKIGDFLLMRSNRS
ncbi:MAG: SDR family NAD(P)-dependent oxidoreductase [Mariniblastus sp.]|nr:SDR family NAD(P)-dependent oxidoreductase [Mariniblastus sp.]